MVQEKIDRVYYDEQGKLYKAEQPKNPTHSQMNFPTQDIFDALDEIAITREGMIARINHPDFKRKQAVLAQEVK